jgi:general secretion pathway protein L
MKLALPRLTLGDAPDIAIEFWHWWRRELVALVPRRLRVLLAPPRAIVTLDWEPEGVVVGTVRAGIETMLGLIPVDALASPDRPALLAQALGVPDVVPDRVLLRLPQTQILRRRVTVPPASARSLRPLIGFELGRSTPFTPDQVRYDFRVIERDRATRRQIVEFGVVKNRRVEELLALARHWRLRPIAIGMVGGDWTPDFLQEPFAIRPALRRHRASLALAGIVATLLLALWWIEADRQADYGTALAAALAQSRGTAESTLALRRDAEALDAHLSLLPRLKTTPDTARILEELAHRLPDGTYLSDFELNGRAIHIRGTSTAATGLIAILGESPLFTNIRFAAPVVQVASAVGERFDLAFELRDGAGS